KRPVASFPAIGSYSATAIVPEGTGVVGASWREGAIGTGAYRVVAFEPGRRLELERNPHYWRAGFPRNEGIVFRFGVSPEEIRREFLAGRASVASDLLPADAEAFRHDARFAPSYKESPRLGTYFVVFNRHRGPLRDLELRRSLVRALNVGGFIRRTLGSMAIPAEGLIPPRRLGRSATAEKVESDPNTPASDSSSD